MGMTRVDSRHFTPSLPWDIGKNHGQLLIKTALPWERSRIIFPKKVFSPCRCMTPNSMWIHKCPDCIKPCFVNCTTFFSLKRIKVNLYRILNVTEAVLWGRASQLCGWARVYNPSAEQYPHYIPSLCLTVPVELMPSSLCQHHNLLLDSLVEFV